MNKIIDNKVIGVAVMGTGVAVGLLIFFIGYNTFTGMYSKK